MVLVGDNLVVLLDDEAVSFMVSLASLGSLLVDLFLLVVDLALTSSVMRLVFVCFPLVHGFDDSIQVCCAVDYDQVYVGPQRTVKFP